MFFAGLCGAGMFRVSVSIPAIGSLAPEFSDARCAGHDRFSRTRRLVHCEHVHDEEKYVIRTHRRCTDGGSYEDKHSIWTAKTI